jgi:RimJ/RimL family protein N-acetyltransferase
MAEPPEGLVSLVACVESELEVYTDNEPAIQLYKKFGFTIEGTLAQFAFRDGQYVDSYTMARLRQVESRNDR